MKHYATSTIILVTVPSEYIYALESLFLLPSSMFLPLPSPSISSLGDFRNDPLRVCASLEVVHPLLQHRLYVVSSRNLRGLPDHVVAVGVLHKLR